MSQYMLLFIVGAHTCCRRSMHTDALASQELLPDLHVIMAGVLDVLRLAMETRKVMLVDIALDLVQKLIAHHHLAGPVFAIGHRRDPASAAKGGMSSRTEDEDGGDAASADGPLPPQVRPCSLPDPHLRDWSPSC